MITISERLERARKEINFEAHWPNRSICDLCGDYSEDCECNNPDNYECGICGANHGEDHSLNCPENDSPFAHFARDGYD